MREMENRTPRPKNGTLFLRPRLACPPLPLTHTPMLYAKRQLVDLVKAFSGQFSELKKMEMAVRSARPKNGTVSRFRDPLAPNRRQDATHL